MRQEIPRFDDIVSALYKACADGQVFSAVDTEEQCRKLAVLNLNDKDRCTSADELETIEKEQNGEWVKCSTLQSVITHLQLLDALLAEAHKREEDILGNLLAHLGNAYYYRMEDLEQLFALAARFYEFCLADTGINRKRFYKAECSDDVKLRIRNAKYLIRIGYKLGVKKGEVDITNAAEQELIRYFDTSISAIGGIWFVTALFEKELRGKYHKGLERYLIMRDKKSLGDRKKIKERIPFAYLLQLGMKHLEDINHLLTVNGRQQKYEEVQRVAKAYLETYNLQGHNTMEDMFSNYEHFPMVLSCNMLYEKMCIPRQYHPEYVELLVTKLIGPFYEQLSDDKRKFTLDEYVRVMRYVMGKAVGPVVVSKEELEQQMLLPAARLNAVLDVISLDGDEVNQGFFHYLDATNTWKKPLIRLSGYRFFCLDARMSGYAFYEVLYQIVHHGYEKKLNRKLKEDLGAKLEEVVRGIFEDRKIPFVKGKYKCLGDLPERDCDMIIEGDKQLLFVEIKKIPLPETYETGDDVAVLQTLGKGMLYAQEQILWHQLRLHRHGVIELEDNGKPIEVRADGKRIFSISLCMPEYDFLSDQMIVKNFLESTLFVSYHAHDVTREASLKELNNRMERIREISEKLFDGQPYNSQQVFFNTSFMSLQQLWMAVKLYPTKEKLLDYCSTSHCIVTGLDVYGNMWYLKELKG